ncbi:hypothetical protein AAC387_Pa02g3076 [Persea americana]
MDYKTSHNYRRGHCTSFLQVTAKKKKKNSYGHAKLASLTQAELPWNTLRKLYSSFCLQSCRWDGWLMSDFHFHLHLEI